MSNVPNILTSLRFFMIPVYILVFFLEDGTKQFSAGIFLLASFTDVLDGFIARKFNLCTRWGQVMDPLADKLMQMTVIASLVFIGRVPIWFVCYLVIMEIVMILAGAFLFKNKIYIKSNVFGKLNTVLLFVFMLSLLLWNINAVFKNIFMGFLVIFSLFTSLLYGYMYFLRNKKYKKYSLRKSKTEQM